MNPLKRSTRRLKTPKYLLVGGTLAALAAGLGTAAPARACRW